jgi:hypothetical protein
MKRSQTVAILVLLVLVGAMCLRDVVLSGQPAMAYGGANHLMLAGTTSPVPPEPPVTLAGTTSPVPPEPPVTLAEATSPVPPEPTSVR